MKKNTLNLLLLLGFIALALWGTSHLFPDLFHKETAATTTGFQAKTTEKCLSCHQNISGFTQSHQAIGCTACHLGNGSATDKALAHASMIAIPGNLDIADQTCSTAACHPGIDYRVKHSVMNTMSGIIAIDRMVFDENHAGMNLHVDSLTQSPADNHLRDLCASCHLGAEKKEMGPIQEQSRGGGCLACHLNYNQAAHQEFIERKIETTDQPARHHPTISLAVSDDHCFGCHSRSGRISLSYAGWHETLLEKEALPDTGRYRLLDDDRVLRYVAEDIHHSKGLACIDCHGSTEVMGDGQRHLYQNEAELSQCQDCHFAQANNRTKPFNELRIDSKSIIRLRNLDTTNYFVQGIKGQDLTNVFIKNKEAFLIGKINNIKYPLSKPSPLCQAPAHQDVSCNACHTKWAPQCIDCHTTYDASAEGYDLLAQKNIKGKWQEDLGPFLADFPALGVQEKNGQRSIITFVPGMILSLDKSAYTKVPKDVLHKRLFAPIVAHTTSAKGRDCKTCHNNPNAIGYGRGQLSFDKNWVLNSAYENWQHDNLPQDAWIGLLQKNSKQSVTHLETRPFSILEQQRILQVGNCLNCHQDQSKEMKMALLNFEKTKKSRTPACLKAAQGNGRTHKKSNNQ